MKAQVMSETKAKAIFWKYACRTFFMARDGIYEEYKTYGISGNQENEWRREYIAHWIAQLSTDAVASINRLRDADAGEALPELIRQSKNGDDYAKLWYANAIWDIVSRVNISVTDRKQAEAIAIEIWQSLIQGSEEYVANYAKRRLANANKNLVND